MEFKTKSKTLTFEFENVEAANHFKLWLCESGEQGYWEWMDYYEQEEDGNITGLQFEYHSETPEVIEVKCGRQHDGH